MACFCGCRDDKKELVLDGNRPLGNHGNCSENVKRQTLSAPAGGISVIELYPAFYVFLSCPVHTVLHSLLLNERCSIFKWPKNFTEVK